MGNIIVDIGNPNEKQRLFLADQHKYVAFGGARGGGKSWAVRAKAKFLALRRPGITQTIIRRTYPELRENHIERFIRELPREVYRYNDSQKTLTFLNGSRILFRYLANDADLANFQGTESDVIYIDEATQFTERQFKDVRATLRGPNNLPKRMYLTCNPGGPGHAWVKRLFIDRRFEGKEKPEEYSFIQSLVWDNKVLMETNPDYVDQLETLDAKHRRAWLEGDWNIFDGAFFEEFRDNPDHYKDRKFTHVIEPFEIPTAWNVYRSFDWGYSKPFSCAWWAVDGDGRAYRILELYGCTETPNEGVKWDPERVFAEIHRIENEQRWLKGRQIFGVADPAIWDASSGESIEEVASKHGVIFSRADNSRLNGWMQVHRRMSFNEEGFPMLYVFKNCTAFIRTIPGLVYDKIRVEDLDTKQEDHVADETRYFCMSRPIEARIPQESDHFALSPQALYLDVAREDIIAKPKTQKMEVIHG